MKLTFFCVAPPKSRMVSPLVSRIWVKNSSNPRLGRTERVAAAALPFSGFLPPGTAGGPPPACPPRDPRKNSLSGSSMTKNAFYRESCRRCAPVQRLPAAGDRRRSATCLSSARSAKKFPQRLQHDKKRLQSSASSLRRLLPPGHLPWRPAPPERTAAPWPPPP